MSFWKTDPGQARMTTNFFTVNPGCRLLKKQVVKFYTVLTSERSASVLNGLGKNAFAPH